LGVGHACLVRQKLFSHPRYSRLIPSLDDHDRSTHAHCGIENNLHWQLDITFDEDRCRTRKDFSPMNLAIVRHIVLNMLKRGTSRLSLKRNRLKAYANPDFRARPLAC
jgi:hypothetical protein